MEEQRRKVQRRSPLRITHRKFQISFLFFSFSIGLIATTTAVIAMHIIVSGLSKSVGGIRYLDWDQIEDLLQAETSKATAMIIAVSVINLVVTAIISFFFSHRVAGIVLRMTKTLHAWSDGEVVTKITPRKGDFFTELVDQVNEVIKNPPPPRL